MVTPEIKSVSTVAPKIDTGKSFFQSLFFIFNGNKWARGTSQDGVGLGNYWRDQQLQISIVIELVVLPSDDRLKSKPGHRGYKYRSMIDSG